MREIEFNLSENPFRNFLSSRYAMSARINVEKMWNWCHENDRSFFVMSMGVKRSGESIMLSLKRRIIDGKVIEYDYLDGVCPIMNEGEDIYREMRVKTPQEFEDIIEWHDYVKELSANILSGKDEGFNLKMEKRDLTNIANFSCIPWVDLDMITNCVVNGNAVQPLITWGKVNGNHEMSVAITVNHIFVNGRELGYFYENAKKEFNEMI